MRLASQSASNVLWTSNGRLYEVLTSYRRLLDFQMASDAHRDVQNGLPFARHVKVREKE